MKRLDLKGKKFGRWEVLGFSHIQNGRPYWLCQCNCPLKTIRPVDAKNLRRKQSRSCGCIRKESLKNTSHIIDLTGKTFTRWKVLKFSHKHKRAAYWICQCQCELKTIRPVSSGSLISEASKSCGCLSVETAIKTHTKHGLCGTPEYYCWQSMMDRCYNPNNPGYKNYGGRGIKVSNEFHDIMIWYNYIGPKPSNKHTLDRYPNNNGNYERGNIRWATRKEQNNNQRSNVHLEIYGIKNTASQWAELIGVESNLIRWRKKEGWSDFECIMPVQSGRNQSSNNRKQWNNLKSAMLWKLLE